MVDDPEEGAAIARIVPIQLIHYRRGLDGVGVRASTRAIADTKSKYHLRRIPFKHIVNEIVVVGKGCLRSGPGPSKAVESGPGPSVVVLRHEEVQVGGIRLEDVVIRRPFLRVWLHGRMRDEILTRRQGRL